MIRDSCVSPFAVEAETTMRAMEWRKGSLVIGQTITLSKSARKERHWTMTAGRGLP
jgi:hypothetical protein